MEFGQKNFNCCATSFSKLFTQSKRFFESRYSKNPGEDSWNVGGSGSCIKKVGDKCLELSRNYSVDPELGTWKETTVKRIIDEKDLPPEIQQKLQQQEEVNNTKTLNEALVCEM